jgi:hypothetical protein
MGIEVYIFVEMQFGVETIAKLLKPFAHNITLDIIFKHILSEL